MTQNQTSSETLPMQRASRDVLLEKYCKGGEHSAAEVFARVADALASVEKPNVREHWREQFKFALDSGFIPAGRILSAAGTKLTATLINCFVQPVGDSVSTSETDATTGALYPSIYEAAREAAETMRRGGGVGYNFSRIRPKGAYVKSTGSRASGPLSYMRIFDTSCETVESAGARRGAQMGILDITHPDILEFISAKHDGSFSHFNLSVGVSDEFMQAVERGSDWELVHRSRPHNKLLASYPDAGKREDGLWVWKRIPAREIWDAIMRSTYNIGEPGIQFLGRIAAENPLYYAEEISCTNPCSEEPLPNYGCCCLGSVDLTRFVNKPFTDGARLDYHALATVSGIATRMLDNVLDLTYWPLEAQREEAANKRRIGLGFTGLGDALIMLGLRYDSGDAPRVAQTVAATIRDAAYLASTEIAVEKGPFKLFDAEKHLRGPFVGRLPQEIRMRIAEHGLRNSHLLAIAPTGTISLALADNASNGIEPVYALSYDRKKRAADGSWDTYQVLDHAYRVWTEELGGETDELPEGFEATALKISVEAHRKMMEAIQPFIDAAISKTVNIPEDYDFEDFKAVYMDAWKGGLKSIATFRPNPTIGSILSVSKLDAQGEKKAEQAELGGNQTPAEDLPGLSWVGIKEIPDTPPLASLVSATRPEFPQGNEARTYTVPVDNTHYAVTIGQSDEHGPFEVWVMGGALPRGLGALAKSLSMDMRSRDRGWLQRKLKALMKCGEHRVEMAFPPTGETKVFAGQVAAFAALVDYHCRTRGVFESIQDTPLLDSMMTAHEPQTGPDGTFAWAADVSNGATGDELVLFVKELKLRDGTRRPYSVWLAGDYPRALDGLMKSLSLDMRILDPAWVAKKLRGLRQWNEPLGEFFARRPNSEKSQTYPSTAAYIAELLLNRYRVLGILDAEGFPLTSSVDLYTETGAGNVVPLKAAGAMEAATGKRCPECGNYSMIKRDGCDHCTNCGAQGGCG